MVKAAKFVEEHSHCDIIDINMGCPVNKVLKAHAGSYLMQYPELAYDIVKAVVEAVNVPVTVKMRIGYDMKHINCVEMTINGKSRCKCSSYSWSYTFTDV